MILVIPRVEKARKNIQGLIPKRTTAVRRGGTTYQTTVWVRPTELEEEKTQMKLEFAGTKEKESKWRVLARHKWVAGATITESMDKNRSTAETAYRRFTATIRGWRNFKIYEGDLKEIETQQIMDKVKEIRDRIDAGDESVFKEDTMIKQEKKPAIPIKAKTKVVEANWKDFEEAGPEDYVIFYHGTNESRAKKILSEGFKIGDKSFNVRKQEGIFLNATENVGTYAGQAVSEGSRLAVVKVKVKKKDLLPDFDDWKGRKNPTIEEVYKELGQVMVKEPRLIEILNMGVYEKGRTYPTYKKIIKSILFGIPSLFKARRKWKLVPKKVTVTRGGKTFQTTVWINPEEEKGPVQYDIFGQQPPEEKKKKPAIFVEKKEAKEKPKEPLQKELERKPAVRVKEEGKKYYEDVGEKIGGAKKDIWAAKLAAMNLEDIEKDPKEAYEMVTKDNILGKFDFNLYREQGYSSQATQLIKELYTSIAPRPQDNPEARQAYVQYLHDIQDALRNARSVQDCSNSLAELMELKKEIPAFQEKVAAGKKYYYYSKPNAQKEMYSVFGGRGANILYMIATHNDMGIRPAGTGMTNTQYWKLKEKCTKLLQLEKTDADNWEWTEPKKKEKGKEKEKFSRVVEEQVYRTGGREIEVEDPEEYLKTFGIRAVEYGNYVAKDKESGDYHTRRCAEALSDLADILGIEDKQIAFNGRLALAFGARGSGTASAHYEPVKTVINMTKFRGGGSVAHEWFHFIDNILYEVENEKKGGKINFLTKDNLLRQATEIKRAMNNVLSAMQYKRVEKDFPVQKTEGIQFKDDYEKRGFDTLFNHANKIYKRMVYVKAPSLVQYAIETMKSNADRFFGKGSTDNEVLIEKFIRYSVNRCIEAGEKLPEKVPIHYKVETNFSRDSRQMGGYWFRTHEMAARAFESYIEDKLTESNRKSTYLVSGTGSKLYKTTFGNIYPDQGERKNMYDAFEKLIEVMRKERSLEKAMRRHLDNYLIKIVGD